MNVESLINYIKDSSLKEALAYLIANGVYNFSKEGFEKIKKIIQDKYNEGRYAFVPNKEEANKLIQIKNLPDYKKIEILTPKYRYIDLIRTGLLIRFYHEENIDAAKKRIQEIKTQIYSRPNGSVFVKITNLPSTPLFGVIMNYLFELKVDKAYSEQQLENELDEIIQSWEQSSKFFDKFDGKDDITKFCKKMVEENKKVFFVLGMKSVSQMIENTIQQLEEENFFETNAYDYKIFKETVGSQPRTEVRVIKRQ